MVLLLADERSGAVLKEDLFPDDLPPGDWTLRPGESVNAEVDLTSRFPQLRDFPREGHSDPVLDFHGLDSQIRRPSLESEATFDAEVADCIVPK